LIKICWYKKNKKCSWIINNSFLFYFLIINPNWHDFLLKLINCIQEYLYIWSKRKKKHFKSFMSLLINKEFVFNTQYQLIIYRNSQSDLIIKANEDQHFCCWFYSFLLSIFSFNKILILSCFFFYLKQRNSW